MRSCTTTRRRTRRALAVAALLPVLALSACGGDDSDDASKDPSPSASTDGKDDQGSQGGTGGQGGDGGDQKGAESGLPPLNQSQLDRAALAKRDLPGWKVQVGDGINEEDEMGTEPKTCLPIADLLGSKPVHPRTANAQMAAAQNKEKDRSQFRLLLSAYAPGDAEKVLAELREAVPQCATFQGTEPGESPETVTTKPTSEKLAVGDESYTFDLVSASGISMRISVVRVGGNTATFMTADLASEQPETVDQAVVEKQYEKLMAAAG